MERLLRVQGDSTRRIAESEGAWWNSEVIEPAVAAGKGPDEIANVPSLTHHTSLSEKTMRAHRFPDSCFRCLGECRSEAPYRLGVG
jgi:hypothetical protein